MTDRPPSISETAFACPHCGAYTSQHWYRLSATAIDENDRVPTMPNEGMKEHIAKDKEIPDDVRSSLLKWAEQMESGHVFFQKNDRGRYAYLDANNLHASRCFNCKKIAVWVHDGLVFPPVRAGVDPNVDLPDEIARDFEEARSILVLSPRGAAALSRLCIQKLCAFLGEKGKNIDDDIASLVAKGLNPLVQQSLDVVRVVGNEAVHPGTLDIRDDPDTAHQLLRLVNLIAEQMITHPKSVKAMYEKLPEPKRAAIEQRDKRTRETPKS